MAAIWQGVFPAVTTKMDESGAVDIEATQRSVDRLVANGVSGVIVLPMLGENAPVPLFDDKGEPSDYTQSAIKFCEDFETERRRTEAFVDLLTSLDLFETKQASFQTTLPDGSQSQPVILADYFGVSEEKLGKLPAEKLAELRDSGALDKIYSHMASLLGWDRLVMIASERAGQQG